VYNPVAHWVWADGGWLRGLGALDFAGGTVVHIASGVAALVCATVLGRRSAIGPGTVEPHDATMTLLGAGLLWFGWFGFNAGSALGANELAVSAFVTTHVAAASGMLAWVGVHWLRHGRATVLGASAGAIAGLVVITPAAGFVTPASALLMGAIGGVGCYFVVENVVRGRVDDALDVFGVHGAGGVIGAILTGVFASKAVNPAGADGLIHGNATLVGVQLIAVLAVAAYSAAVTWVLLRLVDAVVPLRVSADEESRGLDQTQHGEGAYAK